MDLNDEVLPGLLLERKNSRIMEEICGLASRLPKTLAIAHMEAISVRSTNALGLGTCIRRATCVKQQFHSKISSNSPKHHFENRQGSAQEYCDCAGLTTEKFLMRKTFPIPQRQQYERAEFRAR